MCPKLVRRYRSVVRRDSVCGWPPMSSQLRSFEPGALHYKSVAVPMADRISHPARVGILRKFAAVEKDLAVDEILVKDHQQRRSLDDPCRPVTPTEDLTRARGKTLYGPWIIDTDVAQALLE